MSWRHFNRHFLFLFKLDTNIFWKLSNAIKFSEIKSNTIESSLSLPVQLNLITMKSFGFIYSTVSVGQSQQQARMENNKKRRDIFHLCPDEPENECGCRMFIKEVNHRLYIPYIRGNGMNEDIVLSSTPFSSSPCFSLSLCWTHCTTCLFILAYAYCITIAVSLNIFMYDSPRSRSPSFAPTDSRF